MVQLLKGKLFNYISFLKIKNLCKIVNIGIVTMCVTLALNMFQLDTLPYFYDVKLLSLPSRNKNTSAKWM